MPWITAFHVIAMVCWMAGLFYLPRLFVYHAMAEDEATKATFRTMERKLYRGITTPAAIATAVFGIAAAWGAWEVIASSGWFWANWRWMASPTRLPQYPSCWSCCRCRGWW